MHAFVHTHMCIHKQGSGVKVQKCCALWKDCWATWNKQRDVKEFDKSQQLCSRTWAQRRLPHLNLWLSFSGKNRVQQCRLLERDIHAPGPCPPLLNFILSGRYSNTVWRVPIKPAHSSLCSRCCREPKNKEPGGSSQTLVLCSALQSCTLHTCILSYLSSCSWLSSIVHSPGRWRVHKVPSRQSECSHWQSSRRHASVYAFFLDTHRHSKH